MIPGSTAAVKQFSSIQGKGEKSQIQADGDVLNTREGTSTVMDATELCLEGTYAPLGQTLSCRCSKIWKGSRRTGKWKEKKPSLLLYSLT